MTTKTKHTIEQLQAMSDAQLAELTAQMRGLRDNGYGLLTAPDTGDAWRKRPTSNLAAPSWNPAADVAQAYGLLVWAWATSRHLITVSVWLGKPSTNGIEIVTASSHLAVSGNNARAMVCAFVMAMEAIND